MARLLLQIVKVILFEINIINTSSVTINPNLDTLTDCTYNENILISENKDMNLFSGGIMSNFIATSLLSKIKLDGLTSNGEITVTNNTLSYPTDRFNAIFVGKISTFLGDTLPDTLPVVNNGIEIDNINCTENITTITGNDEYYISEEDIDDFVILNEYLFSMLDFGY